MKGFQKAQALRIYLDENLKTGGELTYRAIVKKWLSLGLNGATVYKAVEGFGSSAHLRDAGVLEISENLPIVVETIGKSAQVKKALSAVEGLLPHCLVTLQELKVAHRAPSKRK